MNINHIKIIETLILAFEQALMKDKLLYKYFDAVTPKQFRGLFDKSNQFQQIDNISYSVFKTSEVIYLNRVVQQFLLKLLQNRSLVDYILLVLQNQLTCKYLLQTPNLQNILSEVKLLEQSTTDFVIDYRLVHEAENLEFKPIVEKLHPNMSIRNEHAINFLAWLNECLCCDLNSIIRLLDKFQQFLQGSPKLECQYQQYITQPTSLIQNIMELKQLLQDFGWVKFGQRILNTFVTKFSLSFGEIQIRFLMLRYLLEKKDLLFSFMMFIGGLFDIKVHLDIQKLNFKYLGNSLFCIKFGQALLGQQYSLVNLTKFSAYFAQIKKDFDELISSDIKLCQCFLNILVFDDAKNQCQQIIFFEFIHNLLQSSLVKNNGFFSNGIQCLVEQDSDLVDAVLKIVQDDKQLLDLEEVEYMALLFLSKNNLLQRLFHLNFSQQQLNKPFLHERSPLLTQDYFDATTFDNFCQSFARVSDLQNFNKSYYFQNKRIMTDIHFALSLLFAPSQSSQLLILQSNIRQLLEQFPKTELLQAHNQLNALIGGFGDIFSLIEPILLKMEGISDCPSQQQLETIQVIKEPDYEVNMNEAVGKNITPIAPPLENVSYPMLEILEIQAQGNSHVVEQAELECIAEEQPIDNIVQNEQLINSQSITPPFIASNMLLQMPVQENIENDNAIEYQEVSQIDSTALDQAAPQLVSLLENLQNCTSSGQQFKLVINGETAIQKIKQFFDDHQTEVQKNLITVNLKQILQMAPYRSFIFQKIFVLEGTEEEQYQQILNFIVSIRNLCFMKLGKSFPENSSLASLIDQFRIKKCSFK